MRGKLKKNVKLSLTPNCVIIMARHKDFKREYRSWNGMKQRCYNTNNPAYPSYGGRGIIVCEEWKKSFESFLDHIGPKPSKEYSLDRIDNNGNYEPGNVKWSTPIQQSFNRRSSVRSNNETKFIRTTFYLPRRLYESVKIMAILTRSNVSRIMRIALAEKIKQLNDQQERK